MLPSLYMPTMRWRLGLLPRLSGLAVLAALGLSALTVQAEAPDRSPRPDPLDPQANVPALHYQSSLQTAASVRADKPLSWREANDTVARIGGWRVYAREAQQPEPVVKPSAPASAPSSASASASAPQAAPAPVAAPMPAMPSAHDGHQRPSRTAP